MIYRLLFFALFLSGCRTIQKTSTSTEKKSDLIDENSSKYNRETVTEFVVDTLYKTRVLHDSFPFPVPQYRVYRQTIKETGETQQVKKEQEVVKEEIKEKQASIPAMLQYSVLILAIAVMIIAFVLIIKLFKK